jgi:hypothetical protein
MLSITVSIAILDGREKGVWRLKKQVQHTCTQILHFHAYKDEAMHAYQSWHNPIHITQLRVRYELLKYVHTV